MQGNQNVLPEDRRQAVWEKKRLMEFLAALKKNPLCHSTSPSETVSGLSSLFGAVISQHHGAPTCYSLTASTRMLALGWLSLQHLSGSECSSQSAARGASSQARIVWPCWIILALGASHSSKEGSKEKLDAGLTMLIPLLSFLTPSKRPAVLPVPETWSQHSMPRSPLPVLWPRGRTSTVGCSCHLHTVRAEDLLRATTQILNSGKQQFLVFSLTAQVPVYFSFRNRKNRGR